MKKWKDNKGFTLVELIVVLVILAILAAIMVPALLGYIDRAKNQESVSKMHDLQTAATSALVEYYGLHKDKPTNTDSFKLRSYTLPSGTKVDAYNVTNWSFAGIQKDGSTDTTCGDAVARAMLRYMDSNYGDASKLYTFKNYTKSPFGKKASEVANAKAEGLIILFDADYKLVLLQYSDLKGNLLTYEAGQKSIDVVENGTFIAAGTTPTNTNK